MGSVKLVAGLIVGAAVVLFGAQNTQAVTLHFLVFKVPSAPMALALFAAVVLGVLLGWIVSAPGRVRRNRQRRGLEDQVAAQQRAVTETSQPIGADSGIAAPHDERVP